MWIVSILAPSTPYCAKYSLNPVLHTMILSAGAHCGSLGACGQQKSARADRIIVCSTGFSEYFAQYGVEGARIETIHNWADLNSIHSAPVNGSGGPGRFLYAGNLGYTQGFETLIDAARMNPGMTVEIVGRAMRVARCGAWLSPYRMF